MPFFKTTEHFHYKDQTKSIDPSVHGTKGPINTMLNVDAGDPFSTTAPMIKAFEEAGYPGADSSGGIAHGWGYFQLTQDQGQKQVVNLKYLAKMPEKLKILDNTVVDRVLLEGNKAVGVQTAQGAKIFAKNVIISAGALNTPTILLRSGIGDKADLAKQSIPQVVNLPVGHNLWDHLGLSLLWSTPEHPDQGLDFLRKPENLQAAIGQYYSQDRTGPLAKFVMDLLAYSKLKASDPQIEYIITAGHGRPDCGNIFPTAGAHLGANTLLLHPKSRGTVKLAGADCKLKPVVDPNYYADPSDAATHAAGISELYRIAQQKSFPGSAEFHVYNGVGQTDTKQYLQDQDIIPLLKKEAGTVWHFAGTCKMSADETGVVDSKARVKGIQGLQVVDASIIPTTVSGHLQAVVYMLAEKIASDILGS